MMSSNEQNNFDELISFYSSKLELLRSRDLAIITKEIEKYNIFLEYVKSHPTRDHYSVPKLKSILNTSAINDVISVIQFFSKLLDVQYCYYEGDDSIYITKESYLETIENNSPPISEETGIPISSFDIQKIGFFCMIKHNLRR